MWFGRKKSKLDKNVFEYEAFARVSRDLDPRGKCEYVDVLNIYISFRNRFLNILAETSAFSDALSTFKNGGANEYMLTMPKEDFEEKIVMPAIRKRMRQIMKQTTDAKEIDKIINSFRIDGTITLEEGDKNDK